MNTQQLDILTELFKQHESRFASLTYTNSQKETSHYLVHLNVNYVKVLRRDLKVLEAIDTTTLTEVESIALSELTNSVRESIVSHLNNTVNSNYTKKDYYKYLTNNVKYNDKSELYVNSYVVRKTVITKGEYKTVKSSDKTIAKNKFRKLLKSNQFREFKIDLNKISEIRLNKKVIEIV